MDFFFFSFFLSVEAHELWSKPQQPFQSTRTKLPSKQETNVGALSIIYTRSPIPQSTQKLNGDISSCELGRVGATPGPVNPGQTPIRILCPKVDVRKCWQIMLVCIAWAPAVLLESWEVFFIWDNFNGMASVHLKPLWSFPPLAQWDFWVHMGIIPAPSDRAWIIIDLYKTFAGVYEVRVDSGEVVEGDAGFWEQNKTFVWDVKKSICQ